MNRAKFAVHVLARQDITDAALAATEAAKASAECRACEDSHTRAVLRQKMSRLSQRADEMGYRLRHRSTMALEQLGLAE